MKVNQDLIQIQHDQKVRQQKENHEAELRKLGKLQQHQTKNQLSSIEKSRETHKQMMDQVKNEQNQDYQTQIDRNDEKLLGEIERKQGILAENRNLIETDNNRLDNELDKTKKLYQTQLENLKNDQEAVFVQKHDAFKNNAETFTQSSLDKMNLLKEKYDMKSSDVLNQNTRNLSDTVIDSQRQSQDLRQNFQQKLDKTGFEYRDKLLKQEVEFQNQLKDTDKHNKHVESQNLGRHQYVVESTNQQYNNKLTQEKENFNNQKASLITNSEAEINTIKNAYSKELGKMRESYSKEKNSISDKAADQFYTISTLSPAVQERTDGYEIFLNIPKHESENVIFTAHGRDLKLSVARNFSDDLILPDGSKNLSRKSETFTKMFKVADLVDTKQITRKYEDGVLSFYIKKA